MHYALRIFIFILFWSFGSQAQSIRLFEWSPGDTLAPMILPVREGESPETAAQRYLRSLQQNTDMMELFQGQPPQIRPENLRPLQRNFEKRSLLIMNHPKDYTLSSVRIRNFVEAFHSQGQDSYLLPISAHLGLSRSETRDLFKKIAQEFSLLVAMGGDDIDPRLFHRESFHSINVNPTRDSFESRLIKSYITTADGFFLGVCRGSQLAAATLGYSLITDIPFHIRNSIAHANDTHDIHLLRTQHGLLQMAAPGSSTWKVNSLHHQAVIYHPRGPLELAAVGPDGIVEATELRNGKGLLLQFHPELMPNQLGRDILKSVVKIKNRVTTRTCSGVFQY